MIVDPPPAARVPVSKLLLFGATGDLARRRLLPSLFGLYADGLLPLDLAITGTAKSDHDEASYRDFAAVALRTFLPDDRKDEALIAAFLDHIGYQSLDASTIDGFAELAAKIGDISGGLAIFLSMAPELFRPTIAGLQAAGLTGDRVRIGLEKPLGHDLASSCEINDAIAAAFPEARTFRIDHYLGKETVQNILALRFGNRLFDPIWDRDGVDHVQITIAETVGLEGRGDYYDGAGALRDMAQNHMLQLLALVAMEAPSRFDGTSIRDEKVKVLRALRPITAADAAHLTVLGQYDAGIVQDEPVPGYIEELGRASDTETFIAITAHIDNWRWQGVPFYLRTGKRLPTRHSEIAIQFKPVPHSMFAARGGALAPNRLIIRLQPEEFVRMLVMIKEPGLDREGIRLREMALNLSLDTEIEGGWRRIAYERLLLDLIEGDHTLFVRRDEVEAQWRWIDRIRAGWSANGMKAEAYPAGSWGPQKAASLMRDVGATWHDG